MSFHNALSSTLEKIDNIDFTIFCYIFCCTIFFFYMQVHQELVADLLTSGHVPHALRFLHDTIGLGRPYMGHFRYHGTLGANSFLYISVYVCVLVLLLYVCRHAITLAL